MGLFGRSKPTPSLSVEDQIPDDRDALTRRDLISWGVDPALLVGASKGDVALTSLRFLLAFAIGDEEQAKIDDPDVPAAARRVLAEVRSDPARVRLMEARMQSLMAQVEAHRAAERSQQMQSAAMRAEVAAMTPDQLDRFMDGAKSELLARAAEPAPAEPAPTEPAPIPWRDAWSVGPITRPGDRR
jgi:hypothetical protein